METEQKVFYARWGQALWAIVSLVSPYLFLGLALADGFLVYKGLSLYLARVGEGTAWAQWLLATLAVLGGVGAFVVDYLGYEIWKRERLESIARRKGAGGAPPPSSKTPLAYWGLFNTLLVSPRLFALRSSLSFSPLASGALLWLLSVETVVFFAYLPPWDFLEGISAPPVH